MRKNGKKPEKNFTARARKNAYWRLRSAGVSVVDFCRARGLDVAATGDVLRGRSRGLRGKGHAAAVALGLKTETPLPPPVETHICVSKASARSETRGKAGA